MLTEYCPNMKLSTIEKNMSRALAFVEGMKQRAQGGQRDFFLSWTIYESTPDTCRYCFILFDEWGEILYTKTGNCYRSPWCMVRLGAARDADYLRHIVTTYLERGGFPLHRDLPFEVVEESVLRLNIDWPRYNYLQGNGRSTVWTCSEHRNQSYFRRKKGA